MTDSTRSITSIFSLATLSLTLLASHNAQAQPQTRALEEVVVTAQKTQQSLQDVPISISA